MKSSTAATFLLLLALLTSACQGLSGAEAAEAIEDAWIEEAEQYVAFVSEDLYNGWRITQDYLDPGGVLSPEYALDEVFVHGSSSLVLVDEFDGLPVPQSGTYRMADRELHDAFREVFAFYDQIHVCISTLDGPTCHGVYEHPDHLFDRMDQIISDLKSGRYDS